MAIRIDFDGNRLGERTDMGPTIMASSNPLDIHAALRRTCRFAGISYTLIALNEATHIGVVYRYDVSIGRFTWTVS